MTTTTGWAAYNEAKTRLANVIAEQQANRYPTGTVEFTALVDRYLSARADIDATRRAASARRGVAA
jgi:hypothetical protein